MILFVVISYYLLGAWSNFSDVLLKLRHKTLDYLKALLPQGKELASAKHFAEQMNQATSANQTQTHWHLQQWWILIAGFFYFPAFLFLHLHDQLIRQRLKQAI